MRRAIAAPAALLLTRAGLWVGYDSGDPVSRLYRSPFRFTAGRILGVGVDVSDEYYIDLEPEAAAALARE